MLQVGLSGDKTNLQHPQNLVASFAATASLAAKTSSPAKSKRGWEEGDGTENVINCRDVCQKGMGGRGRDRKMS